MKVAFRVVALSNFLSISSGRMSQNPVMKVQPSTSSVDSMHARHEEDELVVRLFSVRRHRSFPAGLQGPAQDIKGVVLDDPSTGLGENELVGLQQAQLKERQAPGPGREELVVVPAGELRTRR
jgi:hypothetical protein